MKRLVMAWLVLVTVGAVHAGPPAPAGPRQRLDVGAYSYVLEENGNIFCDNGLFRKRLDDGTGTVMMAGDRDNLYILKAESQIWWYNGQGWTLIDEGANTARIVFDEGHCHAVKGDGEIWRCTMNKTPAGEWMADWIRVNDKVAENRIRNFNALHKK